MQRSFLSAWLVATDALALAAAFGLAYFIRFELQLTIAPEVVGESYQGLTGLLILLWLLVFGVFGLYESHARLGGIQDSARTFNACTTTTMLVIVATFFVPPFVISRVWLVSVWVLSFLLVSANHFLARRLLYALRRRGYLLAPAVIVGTNEEAVSLAAFLGDSQASGLWTVGFVRTQVESPSGDEPSVLGSTREIASIVREHGVEELIVAITGIGREELLQLCEDIDALPVQLRLSSGLYELLTTRVEVQTLGTVPLMSLHKIRLERSEAVVKAILDRSIAFLGLVALSPVLLLVALWIRIDSKGPAIHRRRVLGVAGRQFEAFKFRTMYQNGDEMLRDHPRVAEELRSNHKLKDDPRVTRVGRWLRKYSLDELPQLFNVLLGQMSLVGPRMIAPAEAEKYGRHRLNLLTVKPGITGLWQVSGRSDLSYEERIRIDMYYIRNYSVWLDLQILFVQTLPAVVRTRGAY